MASFYPMEMYNQTTSATAETNNMNIVKCNKLIADEIDITDLFVEDVVVNTISSKDSQTVQFRSDAGVNNQIVDMKYLSVDSISAQNQTTKIVQFRSPAGVNNQIIDTSRIYVDTITGNTSDIVYMKSRTLTDTQQLDVNRVSSRTVNTTDETFSGELSDSVGLEFRFKKHQTGVSPGLCLIAPYNIAGTANTVAAQICGTQIKENIVKKPIFIAQETFTSNNRFNQDQTGQNVPFCNGLYTYSLNTINLAFPIASGYNLFHDDTVLEGSVLAYQFKNPFTDRPAYFRVNYNIQCNTTNAFSWIVSYLFTVDKFFGQYRSVTSGATAASAVQSANASTILMVPANGVFVLSFTSGFNGASTPTTVFELSIELLSWGDTWVD